MPDPRFVSEYLAGLQFVAFDSETTGMWAFSNRLVELAAVKFRLLEQQTETFAELINPRRDIPLEVINIHGITNEMVADADTASGVLQRFINFCGPNSILLAHNAPFDISFISCELQRYNLTFGDNVILDTVDIYRRLFPGLESYSLISLGQQFKVAEKQFHRALADAVIVQDLFLRAVDNFPRIDSPTRLKASFTTYSMTDWKSEAAELPGEYAEIRRALDENLPLEIIYVVNGALPQKRVIRPLQVHCQNDIFYINAHCELAESERTFRLDRIRSHRVIQKLK